MPPYACNSGETPHGPLTYTNPKGLACDLICLRLLKGRGCFFLVIPSHHEACLAFMLTFYHTISNMGQDQTRRIPQQRRTSRNGGKVRQNHGGPLQEC